MTFLLIGHHSERAAAAGASHVQLGSGADRLPNETAADWTTYADYIAVVTISAERELPPTDTELGQGQGMILRSVTLDVGNVLWSKTSAPRDLPAKFEQTAIGWKFGNGDVNDRQELGITDASRMEVGHTYIMALEWTDARCSPGDKVPAGWRGLGAASTLPYDDEIVGQGEMEGTVQAATQARTTLSSAPMDGTVYALTVGKSAYAVQNLLNSSKPEAPRQSFAANSAGEPCS
ncbi:hypothetical protein [Flexivirga alba]|uniref:Uncharacterized protein n=1 Tax=Flexivirga alba TaxID=702742 RepID=A0ABW2ACG3_9MICO